MRDGDKSEPKMKPQPAPGAYLCESTERYAAYWLNAAREARDQERYADAVMFAEQAVNGWKNLAYGLARSAHYYSLQQRGDSAPSAVVASKGETPRTDSLYCPEFGTLLHVDTEEGYEHACKLERELASLVDTLHRELLNSGLVTAEQWNDAIAPRLMNLGLAVRAQPSHARLTKPAQVGNTIFDTGVEERLVIDRAHREYEYQQTPERQEDRRKRREDFIASVQAGCQECHPVNGCPNPNLCVVTKRLPTPDDAQPSSIGAQDAEVYKAFYWKHAMGAKVCPSCLKCGKAEPDRERWAIQHAELPNIYICADCCVVSATVPIESVEGMRQELAAIAVAVGRSKTDGHDVDWHALHKDVRPHGDYMTLLRDAGYHDAADYLVRKMVEARRSDGRSDK